MNISIGTFQTDVNVGGIEDDCPPDYDSLKWHKQMVKEGHLYQAMIGNDLVRQPLYFQTKQTMTSTLAEFLLTVSIIEKVMELI
ncbi:MAG: hypothetical protein Q4E33_04350 [Erysipelotrichaceae bacterium]|nr:hypothetical protein [Erysipelotrichaceae bacterium]